MIWVGAMAVFAGIDYLVLTLFLYQNTLYAEKKKISLDIVYIVPLKLGMEYK